MIPEIKKVPLTVPVTVPIMIELPEKIQLKPIYKVDEKQEEMVIPEVMPVPQIIPVPVVVQAVAVQQGRVVVQTQIVEAFEIEYRPWPEGKEPPPRRGERETPTYAYTGPEKKLVKPGLREIEKVVI